MATMRMCHRSAPLAHCSTEVVASAKIASFSGLRSVAFAPKLEKSLRAAVPAGRRNGGAMVASMVASPAVRGADVEFQTEIFSKEKITLAGRDEVRSFSPNSKNGAISISKF